MPDEDDQLCPRQDDTAATSVDTDLAEVDHLITEIMINNESLKTTPQHEPGG